jgi:hypothetical protein
LDGGDGWHRLHGIELYDYRRPVDRDKHGNQRCDQRAGSEHGIHLLSESNGFLWGRLRGDGKRDYFSSIDDHLRGGMERDDGVQHWRNGELSGQ